MNHTLMVEDTPQSWSILDRGVPAEALQYDAYLIFGAELVVGEPLDAFDKLIGLFTPGLSLPGPVDDLQHHGLLLFLNLLY